MGVSPYPLETIYIYMMVRITMVYISMYSKNRILELLNPDLRDQVDGLNTYWSNKGISIY